MRVGRSAIGRFPLIELRDLGTGAFVSVLPTRGGTVHRLGLPAPDGTVREVLYPMRTEIEVERHRWAKGAQLAPWPNRIQDARYEFGGTVHEPVKNFKPQGGHAIHGLTMFETAKLVAKSPEEGWFELAVDSKGWKGYPFPVRISHRFSLSTDGFRMETSIRNTGRKAAPAGHGWHPYFRLGSSIKPCLLVLPEGKMLESTERAVPSGRKLAWDKFAKPALIGDGWLNDCMEIRSRKGIATTTMTDPGSGLSLDVWQETGPGRYGYVQVFTHPRRHCLAIEPMTCAPNAFNNGIGLLVLEPGQELRATCGVRLR